MILSEPIADLCTFCASVQTMSLIIAYSYWSTYGISNKKTSLYSELHQEQSLSLQELQDIYSSDEISILQRESFLVAASSVL